MSTHPAVPAVTRTELRAAADTLAMTLSDADVALSRLDRAVGEMVA